MDNENKLAILRALLNEIRSDKPHFKSLLKQEITSTRERQKENNINKEIIRRLRIQNKKLLERLALTKDRINRLKEEKKDLLKQLKRAAKLNNSLTK